MNQNRTAVLYNGRRYKRKPLVVYNDVPPLATENFGPLTSPIGEVYTYNICIRTAILYEHILYEPL